MNFDEKPAVVRPVPGYELIGEITGGDFHVLHRGSELNHAGPVLLKMPRRTPTATSAMAILQSEYAILAKLAVPGIVHPLEIVQHDGAGCLVLDDPGGVPLDTLPQKPLPFFFKVAIQLCSILGQLHRRNFIHRNINPRWILVNSETAEISLADLT